MVFTYLREKWNERKLEKQRLAEEDDRAIWNVFYKSRTVDDVAQMTGTQFEEFLARLFGYMGYTDIRMTPPNDQGGDLICISPSGAPTVIQAKRWNGSVGNSAVQEVLGAMRHYSCDEGMVVTNSTFTPAAIRLVTGGSDVTLCDRLWLEEKMREYLPTSVPEFRRDLFEEMIYGWKQLTRRAAAEATSRRKRIPRGPSTFTEILRYAGGAKGQELTVSEIKRLARLHINQSEAEANARELEQRLDEAQARMRRLRVEEAALDESISMSEPSSWRNQ